MSLKRDLSFLGFAPFHTRTLNSNLYIFVPPSHSLVSLLTSLRLHSFYRLSSAPFPRTHPSHYIFFWDFFGA